MPVRFIVGFRCRNSHMWSCAKALLNKSLLRESIWGCFKVGCLASSIRRVDEEGIDSSGLQGRLAGRTPDCKAPEIEGFFLSGG